MLLLRMALLLEASVAAWHRLALCPSLALITMHRRTLLNALITIDAMLNRAFGMLYSNSLTASIPALYWHLPSVELWSLLALWLEFIVEAAPLEGRTVECSVTHESSVSNSEKMDCTQRWSLLDRGKVVNDVMKLRKVTDATSLSAAIMDPSKSSSTVCLPRTAPEGASPVVHHQKGHVSHHRHTSSEGSC